MNQILILQVVPIVEINNHDNVITLTFQIEEPVTKLK